MQQYRTMHLFAGAGGGILGDSLLGHRTVCAVEIEEYPQKVLLQRQSDGILPWFPIFGDIKTFDGKPWKGCVDIISGGFPCQDISAAGKGAGIDGEKSGLWGEMARVVREVSPRFVFVENSPMLTSRGLHRVLGDLAEMGYNARWCVLGADDAGAPHRRKRIWILAYPGSPRRWENPGSTYENEKEHEGRAEAQTDQLDGNGEGNQERDVADSYEIRREWDRNPRYRGDGFKDNGCITWWDEDPADIPYSKEINDRESKEGKTQRQEQEFGESHLRESNGTIEPELGRVAHGVAKRVDRLKALGNGQIPAVAATAFVILSEGLI